MKFSKNGKYLASAGQDAAVRVWEVCLNRGEARTESESEQSVSEAGTYAADVRVQLLKRGFNARVLLHSDMRSPHDNVSHGTVSTRQNLHAA